MKFAVLTIFPELFAPFWEHGIIRRAVAGGIIDGRTINIRDFAAGRHQVTDDRPYGGGCGMVMKPEPLAAGIRSAQADLAGALTVLMTPQGRRFDQPLAEQLARQPQGLILVCGRYEGVDERVIQELVDVELSVGDYVLTGGELPAMIVVDAVTRLLPGALGGVDSAAMDSFADGLLEHAHYTRPPEFENQDVPATLLSGDHGAIEAWRLESALIRTLLKRGDLLKKRPLTPREVALLKGWGAEIDRILKARDLPGAGSPSGGQQGR